MNKQEKEELVNQLNSRLSNCPSDSWDKGYNEGIKTAVRVARNLPTVDEPQKVKVSEEFDEWFLQIKQKWEFSEMIARRFALWKICQFGFGHDFEDVSHERTSLDLSRWVSGHREDAINAVWNGYEVEEEPKYLVEFPQVETNGSKGAMYLINYEGKIFITTDGSFYANERYIFTEHEIKAIDERYWPFAVPVEKV